MIINTETQIRIKKIECDTILKATNLQMGRPYVPYEGSYVFTPSLSQQTIEIEDMTAKHDIIIEPMPLGSATTPTTSAVANPSIGVDDNGLITASVSESFGVTPVVEEGYVINGTEGTVSVSGGSTKQLTTKEGTTITPTESVQTAVAKNVYTLGDVNVDAIPSTYIGSGVTQRSSNDVTVNGATVTVPTGYYSNLVSKTVASGTEGTPIATKGAVTNHSVSVTPSVTNVGGYIEGGTHTGTAVSISASDLVSGTKTITENGTNIDVVNFEDVTVNVEGSSVNLESGSATIAAAGTVEHTPSVGYDGFDTFTTTTPSASSSLGTSAYYDFDGGNASWCLNHYVDVNSAGWVASGRTYGNTVHYGAVQSGTTITPSASSQTIGGENYMMQGAITVESAPLNSASRSYTPTESAQSETITPSSGNYGLDEVSVTVGAIPSNYVGSEIVRRDDTDLYGVYDDGSYDIGGPAGYYQYPFYKTVPSASIYGGYDAVVTPSITVNASGLITAGILEEQDFAFCFGSGWVNTSASTAIRVQGYNTLQLTNGNNLEYGLTDATSSRVGVGKVGSMIIK